MIVFFAAGNGLLADQAGNEVFLPDSSDVAEATETPAELCDLQLVEIFQEMRGQRIDFVPVPCASLFQLLMLSIVSLSIMAFVVPPLLIVWAPCHRLRQETAPRSTPGGPDGPTTCTVRVGRAWS